MMMTKNNTGKWNTGYLNTGDGNTGNGNAGDGNTGDRNTGDGNTGNGNAGDGNTGNGNTGRWNAGYRNTGYWNTGDRNTGDCNTGDWNAGNWNTGNRNTGNCNMGDWNAGNYCTGFFNTKDCMAGAFNGPALKSVKDRQAFLSACPYWLFKPSPMTWVPVADMTDAEKQANPDYETTDGYLRRNDWIEEWRKAKATATPEEIQQVRDLPGYDAAVFTKITGLDLGDNNALALTAAALRAHAEALK